jgi:DNA-directed RNA polymerase subunit RPC12/RpoP
MEKTVLICSKCKKAVNSLRASKETGYKGICEKCESKLYKGDK